MSFLVTQSDPPAALMSFTTAVPAYIKPKPYRTDVNTKCCYEPPYLSYPANTLWIGGNDQCAPSMRHKCPGVWRWNMKVVDLTIVIDPMSNKRFVQLWKYNFFYLISFLYLLIYKIVSHNISSGLNFKSLFNREEHFNMTYWACF